MMFWLGYFLCGAAMAPVSYRWWSTRYGMKPAIICAVLTFISPPSIIWELVHWHDPE